MRELVFFVIPIVQFDKDALVVDTGYDLDACSCEFGAELIEAVCRDTFLRAIHVEGRDGRMV